MIAVTTRATDERSASAAPPPKPAGSFDGESATAPSERHAWALGPWWYVYFVCTMSAQAVLALVLNPDRTGLVSALLLVTIVALYLTIGVWMSRQDMYATPGTGVFVLVTAALASTGVYLNPDLGFILFAVAPMFYMTGGALYGTSGIGTVLIVPDLVRWFTGDQPLSELGTSMAFNAAIMALALWYSHWFAGVIMQSYERHELINQLRESRDEAARLSEETGAMAEREHLAREMHDTLAQGFTSIITLTQAVESEMDTQPDLARRHLVLMRETASENLAETRAMVAARQPVRLDRDSLDATLERIAGQLGAELGISSRCRIMGQPYQFPNDLQICVLRTAQEALANVRKHSGAVNAELALAYTDVGVVLTVTDDGRGFPRTESPNGNGLANMRHRAEHVGGTLEVDAAVGGGTVIRLSLPHAEPAEDPGAPTETATAAEGPEKQLRSHVP